MSKHRPSYKIDLLLLGAIGGIGTASSDLFLTILPDLDSINGHNRLFTNAILYLFFLFTAVGAAFFPFISKHYSFQQTNKIFLFLFFLGGVGSITNISELGLILGRLVQGISFGVLQSNVIAFLCGNRKDKFGSDMAFYSIGAEAICLFAPILGVFFFNILGWRGPFLWIITCALALFALSSKLLSNQYQAFKGEDGLEAKFSALMNKKFMFFCFINTLMVFISWTFLSIATYYLSDIKFSSYTNAALVTFFIVSYMAGNYMYGIFKWEEKELKCLTLIVISLISILLTLEQQYYGVGFFFSVAMLFYGLGSGFLYGFIIKKALSAVTAQKINKATSLLVICRLVGSALGVASSTLILENNTEMNFYFAALGMIALYPLIFIYRDNDAYQTV